MKLIIENGLPFLTIEIAYKGKATQIPNVLVDTGSSTTILSADKLDLINITPLPDDVLHHIVGVGGSELVYTKQVDYLKIGETNINNFLIEVGGMDYGFNIDGILGMDYLLASKALINLELMEIHFA